LCARTAVRAPGEVAASYIMETIISQIAHALGKPQEEIREINFHDPKIKVPKAPHGADLTHYTVHTLWAKLKKKVNYDNAYKASEKFNKENRWKKRGVAITPVNYHVQVMTKDATVNLYSDGSILVHHCGCEMGQGLNTKAAQIAASTLGLAMGPNFSLDVSKIRFHDVNTSVIPNGRGTGGSTGSEGVCAAVRKACLILVERLKNFQEALIKEAEEKAKAEAKAAKDGKGAKPADGKTGTKMTWDGLILAADKKGIHLSAMARYGNEKEETFGYNNYGVGFSEVEIDVLTGETNILKSDLIYDCGKSLNPAIDIGQIEGSYVMGVGHLLHEIEVLDKEGKLLSDGTWVYKPCGVKDIPKEFNVELMQNDQFDKGILSSKASGEPPLVLAISAAMAIRMAIS